MNLDTIFLVPYALLFLRIIVAIVFFTSGKGHAMHPVERGKSIGMSPGATKILGIMEMAAAIAITIGIFTQISALILMGVMVGAIYKKMFVWKKKFFEENAYGWHYDLLLLLALLVIFSTDGGFLSIM